MWLFPPKKKHVLLDIGGGSDNFGNQQSLPGSEAPKLPDPQAFPEVLQIVNNYWERRLFNEAVCKLCRELQGWGLCEFSSALAWMIGDTGDGGPDGVCVWKSPTVCLALLWSWNYFKKLIRITEHNFYHMHRFTWVLSLLPVPFTLETLLSFTSVHILCLPK